MKIKKITIYALLSAVCLTAFTLNVYLVTLIQPKRDEFFTLKII